MASQVAARDDRSMGDERADEPADAPADGRGLPGWTDTRPRWRRMVGVVSVAIAGIAASAYVWAVDPNQPGHYPLCPTRLLFGIDCAGCGGLRGTHALLHGDVAGAMDHNAALAVMLPGALVLWGLWARRAWLGRTVPVSRTAMRWRTHAGIAAVVALLAFGVVRNFVPYLGSGA